LTAKSQLTAETENNRILRHKDWTKCTFIPLINNFWHNLLSVGKCSVVQT